MRTVRTLIKIIFRFSSESIALLIKVAESGTVESRSFQLQLATIQG